MKDLSCVLFHVTKTSKYPKYFFIEYHFLFLCTCFFRYICSRSYYFKIAIFNTTYQMDITTFVITTKKRKKSILIKKNAQIKIFNGFDYDYFGFCFFITDPLKDTVWRDKHELTLHIWAFRWVDWAASVAAAFACLRPIERPLSWPAVWPHGDADSERSWLGIGFGPLPGNWNRLWLWRWRRRRWIGIGFVFPPEEDCFWNPGSPSPIVFRWRSIPMRFLWRLLSCPIVSYSHKAHIDCNHHLAAKSPTFESHPIAKLHTKRRPKSFSRSLFWPPDPNLELHFDCHEYKRIDLLSWSFWTAPRSDKRMWAQPHLQPHYFPKWLPRISQCHWHRRKPLGAFSKTPWSIRKVFRPSWSFPAIRTTFGIGCMAAIRDLGLVGCSVPKGRCRSFLGDWNDIM